MWKGDPVPLGGFCLGHGGGFFYVSCSNFVKLSSVILEWSGFRNVIASFALESKKAALCEPRWEVAGLGTIQTQQAEEGPDLLRRQLRKAQEQAISTRRKPGKSEEAKGLGWGKNTLGPACARPKLRKRGIWTGGGIRGIRSGLRGAPKSEGKAVDVRIWQSLSCHPRDKVAKGCWLDLPMRAPHCPQRGVSGTPSPGSILGSGRL